jgi:hypothetical protein
MGKIVAEWLDENQRILLWVFEGKWGWTEFYESMTIAHQMIRDAAPDRVDIVALFVTSPALPPNAISNIKQISLQSPENWLLTVIVGAGPFINTMVSIGRRANRNLADKYAVADTMEDALALIAEQRQPHIAPAKHSRN